MVEGEVQGGNTPPNGKTDMILLNWILKSRFLKEDRLTRNDFEKKTAGSRGLQMFNLEYSLLPVDIFERRLINYCLRVKDLVQLPNTRTFRYGNNSLKFRGSMLWNTLPDTIKSAKDYRQFRNRIKTWTGSTCNCLICK